MTADWGGAQWLLAGYMGFVTAGAPVLRLGLLKAGWSPPSNNSAKSWYEFWVSWTTDFISHLTLVLILRWGGFW